MFLFAVYGEYYIKNELVTVQRISEGGLFDITWYIYSTTLMPKTKRKSWRGENCKSQRTKMLAVK